MRTEILHLLETDSRLSVKDISTRIGQPESAVAAEIAALMGERVICGYHTLINWDKIDAERVTALIEVKVTPGRDSGFDKIAERIYRYDEVSAVYLMSGGFDLTVIIEGKTLREVANFVYEKLATLESVMGTATHFVLKKYKDHNVILEKAAPEDERMAVSP